MNKDLAKVILEEEIPDSFFFKVLRIKDINKIKLKDNWNKTKKRNNKKIIKIKCIKH